MLWIMPGPTVGHTELRDENVIVVQAGCDEGPVTRGLQNAGRSKEAPL